MKGTHPRLRRAIRFARPYRRAIAIIAVLTLVLAALNAAEPLVLKYVFDGVSARAELRALQVGAVWLIVIGIFREAAGGCSNWLTWQTRIGLHYELLEATVGRLHQMPLRLQRSEGVGAIITRLDRSIQGFIGAIAQILFNVFPSIVYLVVSFVVMIQLDWRLALVVLLFAPFPAILARVAAPEQTRRERTLLDQWARIYSRFNEVLSGIVTVRSFAMEDAEKQRFLREVREANRVVIRGVGFDTGFGAAGNLVVSLARVTVVAAGGAMVLRGELTVGTLIAFLGYVGGIFGPVQGLSGVYQTLQRARVSLDEVFAILDLQEHLGDAPDAREVTQVRGDILFENVRFTYEQGDKPLLNGIHLHVRAGETLAIVGPSGSGKTTLMALLMRFYDPIEGRILLDGQNLRSLRQSSLRRNIGVVLQDPLLFNDTIRNNIAYGRPAATFAEIEKAARAANAEAFILRMPERYESLVGERGTRLSVGERQRITIARALVKDPPIVILDEATSSLDAESEALVQEALQTLIKGRTTFVIAHRLSTVVNADRIIVLQDGVITESGTHDDLWRLGGYYASLVRRQTQGLISNEGEEEQPWHPGAGI
jgi:ATP-binding cassette subfamily B protein